MHSRRRPAPAIPCGSGPGTHRPTLFDSISTTTNAARSCTLQRLHHAQPQAAPAFARPTTATFTRPLSRSTAPSSPRRRNRTCAFGTRRYAHGMAQPTATNRPPVICCYRRDVSLFGGTFHAASKIPTRVQSFNDRANWHVFPRILFGLRTLCPPAKPVVVRASRLPDDTLGQCTHRRQKFVIQISHRLREHDAIEVVVHEWAHALAWNYLLDELGKRPNMTDEEFERHSHDAAWGCAYSRAYRVYREACRR